MTPIAAVAEARAIVHRTRGHTQGPITRLMRPCDLGGLLKPFVPLDLIRFTATADTRGFGMHPHSGIGTPTFMLEGNGGYEDTTGNKGVLLAGGVEWMRAGHGVWHTGGPAIGATVIGAPVLGFQLRVALPAGAENAPVQSIYRAASQPRRCRRKDRCGCCSGAMAPHKVRSRHPLR